MQTLTIIFLILLAVALGLQVVLMGLLFCVTFVVGIRTRRLVYSYGPPQQACPHPDPDGYVARRVDQITGLGFTPLGWCRCMDDGTPDFHVGVFICPDRTTLATVGIGSIGRRLHGVTWIQTLSADELNQWVTTDGVGGLADASRKKAIRTARVSTFAELLAAHVAWTAPLVAQRPALRFSPGAEFRQLAEHSRRSIDQAVQAGTAMYVDPARERWRSTVRGALHVAAWTTFASARHAFFGRRSRGTR